MKSTMVASCMLLALVGAVSAQQVNSSNSASASGSTAVSADKSGAKVQSENQVDASSRTSATAPKHQPANESKPAKHSSDDSKGAKSSSMNATDSLAAGTTVGAVLSKPVDSRKCKPGDQVVATAAEDVKSDGKVVIRKGSKLIGHVTESKAKGDGEASSSLGILFDRALLKNGQEVQMNSVIQTVAAGPTAASSAMSDESLGAMSNSGVASTGGVRSGGGLVGGVASATRSTTGAVANVGGSATGAVNSTLGSTASVGNGLHGSLNSTNSGVVGLKGLSLVTDAASATHGNVITSTGKSVHLDSGTQMILRVVK